MSLTTTIAEVGAVVDERLFLDVLSKLELNQLDLNDCKQTKYDFIDYIKHLLANSISTDARETAEERIKEGKDLAKKFLEFHESLKELTEGKKGQALIDLAEEIDESNEFDWSDY